MRLLLLLSFFPCFVMAQSKEGYCGDGVVQAPEECDNGNTDNGDGCSEYCFRETLFDGLRGDKDGDVLDPNIAFRRSLVTTLFLPSGLGLVYGPSMGHMYAGESGRAVLTSLLRAGLLAGAVAVQLGALGDAVDQKQTRTVLVFDALALQGLVAIDLLDGPRAVERTNKKKAIIQGRTPKKKDVGESPTSQPASSPTSTKAQ